MYYKGEGVAKDYRKTAEWTRFAANQGHFRAQFFLAERYGKGQGVPKDHKEAAKWTLLSANQKFDVAQYSLGLLYATGKGVPKDLVKAYKWLNLASLQGYKPATNDRNRLAKKMTTLQVKKAERLSKQWKSKK